MKTEIVCAIAFLFGSLLFSWDGALYVSECGEAVDNVLGRLPSSTRQTAHSCVSSP
jgi:hypothetical protein